MVRRAAALLALVVLSGVLLQAPLQAQEARTHTVTRGETLWDLARTYYDNPFEWRRIHEANQAQIEDPHWIYPGQVFTIPGISAEVTQMEVRQPQQEEMATGVCPDEGDRTVFYDGDGGNGPCPSGEPADRTIFYGSGDGEQGGPEVVGMEETPWLSVPRDVFYSAPWLRPASQSAPPHLTRITEFRREGSGISTRTTARPYEQLRLRMAAGDRPEEGALLQTFRVVRTIEPGQVVKPTGLLTVIERTDSGVVAVVSSEYARVQLDDMVRIAPAFDLEPGFGAQPIQGGPVGQIIGFEGVQEISNLGHAGFVDLGSADGLQVGDVLEALAADDEGWHSVVVGRLQVLLVQEHRASFRISEVMSPVIRTGTRVRVSARLP